MKGRKKDKGTPRDDARARLLAEHGWTEDQFRAFGDTYDTDESVEQAKAWMAKVSDSSPQTAHAVEAVANQVAKRWMTYGIIRAYCLGPDGDGSAPQAQGNMAFIGFLASLAACAIAEQAVIVSDETKSQLEKMLGGGARPDVGRGYL